MRRIGEGRWSCNRDVCSRRGPCMSSFFFFFFFFFFCRPLPRTHAAISDVVSVSLFRSVDLPTLGNPMRHARASPDVRTSKPAPVPGVDLPPSSSSARYFASLALSEPRWCSVAWGTTGSQSGRGSVLSKKEHADCYAYKSKHASKNTSWHSPARAF
jgi:hypothetical protein